MSQTHAFIPSKNYACSIYLLEHKPLSDVQDSISGYLSSANSPCVQWIMGLNHPIHKMTIENREQLRGLMKNPFWLGGTM